MKRINSHWRISQQENQLKIRCLHPSATAKLIRHVTLTWDDGNSRRAVTSSHKNKSHIILRINGTHSLQAAIKAELDLDHEYESLRSLKPIPGALKEWLCRLRENKQRWRGLINAAYSTDPALTVSKHYHKRFIPQLCRLAILYGVNDPGLAVLMGFTKHARQLHSWLTTIQTAKPQHLAVLQLNPQYEIGGEERLLSINTLIKQADEQVTFATAATTETVPLLQYWQGEPIPSDVKERFQRWEETFSELQTLRLDSSSAVEWIKTHENREDLKRFQRCWHPAMQSDLFRVLYVARMGGVYLDGDTPIPETEEAQERWRQLMQHCYQTTTLALCINSINRPGEIRHYVTNCCLFAPPLHVKMQQWIESHRKAIDNLPSELIGKPQGIHRLGPELISHLVDQWIGEPGTTLSSVQWNDVRLPLVKGSDWELLLIDTHAYRALFGVPFSEHASYQGCKDPRDWKLGQSI